MRIVPISIREGKRFVREHHRHAPVVTGAKIAIGLEHDGELIGVGLLGRPKSRRLAEDRFCAEAVRVCTSLAAPKGAVSKLNSRLKRLWQMQGGVRFVSYTLASESGASLRGCGAVVDRTVRPEKWSRAGRPRSSRPIEEQPKLRWDFGELPEIPA